MAAERGVARVAKGEKKQREKAAATVFRIQRRKETAVAKSKHQIKLQYRSKLCPSSEIGGSQVEHTGGGENARGCRISTAGFTSKI